MATMSSSAPACNPAGPREFRALAEPRRAVTPLATDARAAVGGSLGPLLPCFAITIFLSAMLLFLVQPMVGKMILPRLGGTPAVWNACMLFFQAALLAGYGYAHLSTTWLGARRQAAMHVVILALPLLVLPIVIGPNARPPAEGSPALWLLGQLFVAVGLPFFVVSTTGPLLQKWFAGTGHPSAADPYFLYAASNAGSLIALLGYPILVEPYLPVGVQTRMWSIGYWAFAVLVATCAMLTLRASRREAETGGATPRVRDFVTPATAVVPKEVTRPRRMWWVLAAFVPSSLMLGVTTHITSNLAPVPLLWVLPLALYLLTFILVFARNRPIPHSAVCHVLPFLLPPIVVLTYFDLPRLGWVAILGHLVTFFVAAMVCHGELADRRPGARHLTEFYLWMSIGGVLGGVFNALIAPTIFDTIAEYPIAIILVCLLLPKRRGSVDDAGNRQRDLTRPVTMGILAAAIILAVRAGGWGESLGLRMVVFTPLALVCFSFKNRPVRLALGMCVFVAAMSGYSGLHRGRQLYAGRNFFGVKRVTLDTTGKFRVLIHGGTTHGKQFADPARGHEPLTYYHRTGPLGDIFAAVSGVGEAPPVAAVGLGAGSAAAYVQPGQSMTFYEIDPEVAGIARDPDYFTFLSQCLGTCDVVLGDGRLTLSEAADGRFGLVLLDAFSSDAIPTHLLTREAMRIYVSKLDATGVLAFHISNRYLDLEPLLGGLAADAGLVGLTRSDRLLTAEAKSDGKSPAVWVVLARRPEHFGVLATNPAWQPIRTRPGDPVWTDQYTSILSYLVWR